MIDTAGVITVPTPGTPVRATANLTLANGQARPIHGVMFQALPGNTGKIYIGKSNLDSQVSPPVGVLSFLAVPTTNHIPSFSVAITPAPNALNLLDFWVDSDVEDDGVIVTILVL